MLDITSIGRMAAEVTSMKPEARLRSRCRMYLTKALPLPGWFTAIEHGRKHTGTKEQRAREWQRLAAQGVKKGIPDMEIHDLGYIGVELKVGADQSGAQSKVEAAIVANGGTYWLVRSVVTLHDNLVGHGVPVRPSFRVLAMQYDAVLAQPEKKGKGGGNEKPARPSKRAQQFHRSQYE